VIVTRRISTAVISKKANPNEDRLNMKTNKVYVGNVLKLANQLSPQSIQAVICSPPYAEQRKKHYASVSENLYPDWTVNWAAAIRPALKSGGSLMIVIKPHSKGGRVSDYVDRTVARLRQDRWWEQRPLIWIKPDAPPVGNKKLPRDAWEYILWFTRGKPSYSNIFPKANGKYSDRIGFNPTPYLDIYHGTSECTSGTARSPNVIVAACGNVAGRRNKNFKHPAQHPVPVYEHLVRLVTSEGQTVLDPFAGSGTTLVAAKNLGRQFIGFELQPEFAEIARKRLLQNVKAA